MFICLQVHASRCRLFLCLGSAYGFFRDFAKRIFDHPTNAYLLNNKESLKDEFDASACLCLPRCMCVCVCVCVFVSEYVYACACVIGDFHPKGHWLNFFLFI